MSGRQIRLVIGVLGTIVAIVGETIALQSGELAERRHAAPGDRPDLPVRRAGDLGPRAGQPDGQADDRRRADLVHRHRHRLVRSRSSASSRSRSRTRSPCCSSPWCSPTRRGRLESRIDRAAVAILAVGATALNILYSTSLPLISRQELGTLRRPGAGDDEPRSWSSVAGSSHPRVRGATCCPCSSRAWCSWRTLLINIVRRIADVPDDVGGDPHRGQGPCAGGDPGRAADRLLPPERAPPARAGRGHPGPDDPLHATTAGTSSRARDVESTSGRRRPACPAVAFHELLFREAGPSALAATAAALDTGRAAGLRLLAWSLPGGTRQFEARIAPSGADEVTAIVRDFTTSGRPRPSCGARGRGSSRRPTPSGDGWSATCTTAPSSGSSRCRWRCACCGRGSPARRRGPEAIAAADEAAARSSSPSGSCASSPGASTRRSSPRRGSDPRSRRSRSARRSRLGRGAAGSPAAAAVEATAYFVVSEALANVAKYAAATRQASPPPAIGHLARRGRRRRRRRRGPGRGTGIRGLQDRVAALGGRLTVDSPPGEGRASRRDPDRPGARGCGSGETLTAVRGTAPMGASGPGRRLAAASDDPTDPEGSR